MNILFILFNRPKETARVFAAIRQARPEKLSIAADGPRPDRGEEKLCTDARGIIKLIDWPCDVRTRLQDENLGCKKHVSMAISWFFENVDEGIILEDDCLPQQTFFPFCQDLLEKYRGDHSIMHISGTTFVPREEVSHPEDSYHFSRCVHVWGWATWKKAWQRYDIEMSDVAGLQKKKDLFSKQAYLDYWTAFFKYMKKKQVDTWDAQWQYSALYANGFAITPTANLIENIGFDQNATHTKIKDEKILPTFAWLEKSSHPKTIAIDQKAENFLMNQLMHQSPRNRMLSFIKKILYI
jgi:hypothetical protein